MDTRMTRKRTYHKTPRYDEYKRRRTGTTTYRPLQFSQTEWKYKDVEDQSQATDTTGAVVLVNGLVPGTSASTRVGNNVECRTFEMRFVNYATTATGIDQIHRVLLVRDSQTNGATPGLTDILTDDTIYGLRNLANRKRFKILFDHTSVLNAIGEPGAQTFTHKYVKFRKPIRVEYNTGTAGTVADITSNGLFLLFIGNVNSGTAAGTTKYTFRLRYTDA